MTRRLTNVRARIVIAGVLFASTLVFPTYGAQDNSIPDFSGFWVHPFLGFESPTSGPGPVRNKLRAPSGAGDFSQLVGDYTNPILKPEAAEVVKKRGEISLSGLAFPDPDNQCQLQPVPYIFWNFQIEILQQPNKITILYPHDQDHREVRMNQLHPAKVTPSIHGDSVGHYEGDTLVTDTVGIKVGKYSMIDRFGTPYTNALHVVERYRPLDYEAAVEAQKRAENEWVKLDGADRYYWVDPNYKGKGLQLEFTVEDSGVFTMPWSGVITYRRGAPYRQGGSSEWTERVCAENVEHDYAGHYYSDKDAHIPTADKPDF